MVESTPPRPQTSPRIHWGVIVPVIVLIGAGIPAFYFWWWIPTQRADNEREACRALVMLTRAEFDFRANDRDNNGIHDFWTADVSELFRYGLIDRGVAEADTAPLTPLTSKPVPYHGYLFVSLGGHDNFQGTEHYSNRVDTGGTRSMGKVHHLERFGFCAFPVKPGVSGQFVFIMNEYSTLRWRAHALGVPQAWPNDTMLQQYWAIE